MNDAGRGQFRQCRDLDVRAQVAAILPGAKPDERCRQVRKAAVAPPRAEAIDRPVAGRRKVEFVIALTRIGTQECLETRMLPETVAAACKVRRRQRQPGDVAFDAIPDLKDARAGPGSDLDADPADGFAGALGMWPELGRGHAHRTPLYRVAMPGGQAVTFRP